MIGYSTRRNSERIRQFFAETRTFPQQLQHFQSPLICKCLEQPLQQFHIGSCPEVLVIVHADECPIIILSRLIYRAADLLNGTDMELR
ncbi:hypothetical protein D3C84_818140 [compost metagenome]